MPPASALQLQLARQIAEFVRAEGLQAGDPINQLALAERFGVSRTPVRAALSHLADLGFVAFGGRGVHLRDPSIDLPGDDTDGITSDDLIAAIARDRHIGSLEVEVTESDLMRRYGVSRAEIAGALRHLAELGIVMRKPGFGWRFLVSLETPEERLAAFRFRIVIECAALLEPGYHADHSWLEEMQRQHEQFLSRRWRRRDAIAFFEMNAEFHLGLVRFSGNRFFAQATEQQNRLRRLRNYSWKLGHDRVTVSCRDHLSIIDAVKAGDMNAAEQRMRAHLGDTAALITRAAAKKTA